MRHNPPNYWPCWVLAIGLAFSPRIVVAAPVDPTVRLDELFDQADEKRRAGAHAEAAELHAEAYRLLPPEERFENGPFTIKNCIQDYENALRDDPEGLGQIKAHLAMLRAEVGLLREFERDMAEYGPTPEYVEQALAQAESRIQRLEQEEAALEHQPGPTPPVPGPPTLQLQPTEPTLQERVLGSNPTRRHSARDIVLLSVGSASLVGGITMLGVGGWMYPEITRRSNALVQQFDREVIEAGETERSPEQVDADEAEMLRQIEAIEEYRKQSRRNATGLVVSGALLTATGVGLTTWAILRLRQKSASVSAQLGQGYVGLGVKGRF